MPEESSGNAADSQWYFFVSARLVPSVKDAFIRPDVMGSDHCPVGLLLETQRQG